METRYQRETNEVVLDQVVHLTDALPATNAHDGSTRSSYHYELAVWETTAIISSAANAFTLYLPPVEEAKGKIYTAVLVVYGAAAVTVDDIAGDSEDMETASLDANYDRVAYYSNGTCWFKLNVTEN